MRKFKCLAIASPSFSNSEILLTEATALAERVIHNKDARKWIGFELIDWLNQNEADAAVIGTETLHAEAISKLKYLKAIGKYGVGCDNIDQESLHKSNIFFGWEGGVNRRSVSELVLSFMLGHCRNVFRSIDKMQNGTWDKNGGVQLSNQNIGIVGLGYIGTDLASLLRHFGCTIRYYDIVDKAAEADQLGIHAASSYEDLIKWSDVLSFHVPGSPMTKNLFGEKQIAIARKNLLIINTSRGNVVDFKPTAQAVSHKTVGGYASDVFPEEPFTASTYRVSDGFYFTPHIGGNAREAIVLMGRSALKGLQAYLSKT